MMNKRKEKKQAEVLSELADKILAGEQVGPLAEGEVDQLAAFLTELKKTTEGEPADEAFRIRTRNLAMAALPKPVEKISISDQFQSVLAKLIGEEEFRKSFFSDPEKAVSRAGFQLSAVEIAALKEMEPENMDDWMSDLDERISKSGFMPDDLDL